MIESGLAALVEALPALDQGELLALAGVADGEDPADRARAWAAVREAGARLGLTTELERIEGEITRWSTADGARSGFYTMGSPVGDLLLADLRTLAVPVLVGAAAALLLGDALDPEARDLLLAPWEAVRSGDGAADGERSE